MKKILIFGKSDIGEGIKKIYPHNSVPNYAPDIDKWVINGIEYDEYKQIVYKFDKPLMKGYAQQLDVKEWNRPMIDSFVKERPIKGKLWNEELTKEIQKEGNK